MENSSDKIYTKRGDRGETQLLSGEPVAKDDARVRCYGALDELQSHLGMVRALVDEDKLRNIIYSIQQDIFVACSELASTSPLTAELPRRIGRHDTARLEQWIDDFTASYGLPERFVVPGRSQQSAALHIARAVCRRGERLIVAFNRQVKVYGELLAYFNRLSDLLFVLAWYLEIRALVEMVVRDLLARLLENGAS